MNEIGIPIDKISSIEWMVLPLLLVLVSYAVIRHMQVGIIGDSFRQYFSFTLSNQDYKGSHGLSSRLSIALALNSVIVISILIYKLLVKANVPVNPYLLYGLVVAGVLLLLLIKLAIISLVKSISETGDVLEKAKSYNYRYYQIIGVLLLPGIIAVLFFPHSTNINIQLFGQKSQNIGEIYCVFLLAMSYVIRLFQSIRQSLGVKVSWYYIILYLCTLEILPLVVAYRLLVGKF
tara:strand:- start:73 stop:774 length:702 start_codon:yes stop_codon:yes gene_type:complete